MWNALRLRDLFHMKHRRDMGPPDLFDPGFKYFTQLCVIPALYIVNINAIGIGSFCMPSMPRRSTPWWSGIPSGQRCHNHHPTQNGKRYLQYAGCIDRFPEMPSEVEASPIVQKQTSSPFVERSANCFNASELRNSFDASASPIVRGIWAAVGAISVDIFF